MAHSPETIGARIKRFRLMNKMSAQALADAADLSRAVIVNIERNRRTDLTFQELVAISEVLGVPLAALVYEVERPSDGVQVGNREVNVFDAVQGLVGESGSFWEVHDTPAADFVGEILHCTKSLTESRDQFVSLMINLLFAVLKGTQIQERVAALLDAGYTHESSEITGLFSIDVMPKERADYALFLIKQGTIEQKRWHAAAEDLRELGGEPGALMTPLSVWQNTEITGSRGVD